MVNNSGRLRFLSFLFFFAVFCMGASQGVRAAGCVAEDGSSGHQVSFVNKSGEALVIGVYGSAFSEAGDRLVPDHGYPHPQNWVLAAADGSTLSWCAPQHFNGRFFARTGCVNGKCKTGDCCTGGSCAGNVCNKTADPTSLAEIYVDGPKASNPPNGLTYYDISFVDGYDFPLLMKPVNMSPNPASPIACGQAGCQTTPACPWGVLVNGACLAPYKQFELDYADDYQYRPGYYPLAAMCVQNMFSSQPTCGCGKTKDCALAACPTTLTETNPFTKASVTLTSSGCSPINPSYNQPGEGNGTEQDQIACDPNLPDGTTTVYGTACHPWPAAYKVYTTSINTACGINGTTVTKGVYTWQYDDAHGLFACGNDSDMGFAVTILPRNLTQPQATAVVFNPGYKDTSNTVPVTGSITQGGKTYHLLGPNPLQLAVKNGDTLKLDLDCANQGFTATCNMVYKGDSTGFVVDPSKVSASACSDSSIFTDWGKKSIGLPYPDNSWCSSTSQYRLQISPASGVQGYACIGSDSTPKSFSPGANPPIQVLLSDNSLFRFVQYCGLDKQGQSRIIACSADFSLAKGFVAKKISGASSVCTDGRINWTDVFNNKNLGVAQWVTDVDCVKGQYAEACPATYSTGDAQSALAVRHNQPTTHRDPEKLDINKDGQVDTTDVIMMLRRSAGH